MIEKQKIQHFLENWYYKVKSIPDNSQIRGIKAVLNELEIFTGVFYQNDNTTPILPKSHFSNPQFEDLLLERNKLPILVNRLREHDMLKGNGQEEVENLLRELGELQ